MGTMHGRSRLMSSCWELNPQLAEHGAQVVADGRLRDEHRPGNDRHPLAINDKHLNYLTLSPGHPVPLRGHRRRKRVEEEGRQAEALSGVLGQAEAPGDEVGSTWAGRRMPAVTASSSICCSGFQSSATL